MNKDQAVVIEAPETEVAGSSASGANGGGSAVKPTAAGAGPGAKTRSQMGERSGATTAPADFTTLSGVPVKQLYTQDDLNEFDYDRDLGDPGEYPYTRGIHRTMYRGKLWTMRQFSGFGAPEDINARLHYLLKQGQTGLSIAFDLPTLMGYDSDHMLAEGEVGKCGVAIASLADMEVLLRGLPLE